MSPLPASDVQLPPDPVVMRVLVVDDQRAVREGIKRLIQVGVGARIEVATASTAREALVAATQVPPHVIVLDVDLAGDDGLLLMPQLSPAVRVVVLTSHGDSVTRSRAVALGAAAFVEKHEPAAVLIGHLNALAQQKREGEQSPSSRGPASWPSAGESSAGLQGRSWPE